MRRIALHPTLGTEVLRHLREFGPLPETGIVAGQAVASVIDRMQGLRHAPINDIDIFRRAPSTKLKRASQSATGTVMLRHVAVTSPGQVMEYEALASAMDALRSYRVSSVSRQGLLNFVNCDLPEVSVLPTLTAGRVLEAFDLNCVRVAVDLATGRLHWDGHYARFLKHRRIEVAAVHTPWHTFLRALKKAHELPDTTLDLEATAMAVTAFSQTDIHEALAAHNATTSHFGPMLFERAQAFKSYWSRYFDMVPRVCKGVHNGEDVTIYALRPRGFVEPALVRRIDALNHGALHFAGPLVHGLFAPSASPRTTARLNEVEARMKAGDEHRLGAFMHANPFVFAQGHLSERHIDTVSDFLVRNHSFRGRFAALTLDEQFEAAKCLERLRRKAVSVATWEAFCRHVTPTELKSREELEHSFEALTQARVRRLFAKAPKLPALEMLADAPEGLEVKVRELASLDDIEEAGGRGYPDWSTDPFRVRKGRRFIFEIAVRDVAKRSTSLSWVTCDGRYNRPWKAHLCNGPGSKDPVHVEVRKGLLKALIPKASYRIPIHEQPVKTVEIEDDIPF